MVPGFCHRFHAASRVLLLVEPEVDILGCANKQSNIDNTIEPKGLHFSLKELSLGILFQKALKTNILSYYKSNPLAFFSGHVRFIDYEYSSYNYQAFDIGNHFNEFAGGQHKKYNSLKKKKN